MCGTQGSRAGSSVTKYFAMLASWLAGPKARGRSRCTSEIEEGSATLLPRRAHQLGVAGDAVVELNDQCGLSGFVERVVPRVGVKIIRGDEHGGRQGGEAGAGAGRAKDSGDGGLV